MNAEAFVSQGYAIAPGALAPGACEAIANCARVAATSSGVRSLLGKPWCASLANRLRQHNALACLIPVGHVAVQCTYFEKSAAHNWLVPIHQDLSIPVAERVVGADLQGWSTKDGAVFVRAPLALLENLLAVRVHLDVIGANDGPLRVVPGSHTLGVISPEDAVRLREERSEVACLSDQGATLVMRPLLLHASSKCGDRSRRRVLHFVFGPRDPGHGLQWKHAV